MQNQGTVNRRRRGGYQAKITDAYSNWFQEIVSSAQLSSVFMGYKTTTVPLCGPDHFAPLLLDIRRISELGLW